MGAKEEKFEMCPFLEKNILCARKLHIYNKSHLDKEYAHPRHIKTNKMAGFAIYLQYMDALAILGYLGKSTKSLKINSKILQTD